jgi:hypothetical protein
MRNSPHLSHSTIVGFTSFQCDERRLSRRAFDTFDLGTAIFGFLYFRVIQLALFCLRDLDVGIVFQSCELAVVAAK